MALYDPLGQYLKKNAASHIPMTFREVESVIGRKLPASAYRHRPWWANEERGHSHAKAWLQAGYETEQVDMAAKKLVFRRARSERGVAEERKMFSQNKPSVSPAAQNIGRHPMIGALKGTFTIEPGWDLTKPALDPEELEAWEAKLDRMADALQEKLSRK
jgi:hypothetical protein